MGATFNNVGVAGSGMMICNQPVAHKWLLCIYL